MRTGDSEELVATTIDLISRKWHPVIVQRLLETGPLGFSELQATVEGISAKVLTDSLADLGEHDLIERTVVSETPLRVEYELTERGRDLQSVIVALEEWGERHLEAEPDPLVLVVDDDPRTVSMYDGWLDDRFLIERAYSGEEAIRKVTDDVDVVLLDRHMPGLSGDEVVAKIREMGVHVGVVMLTAVEPDFDVVDVPFDAYVEKPSERAELVSIVEEVRARGESAREMRELLALQAKRTLLQGAKTNEELAENGEYARLDAKIDRLDASIADSTERRSRATEGVPADDS